MGRVVELEDGQGAPRGGEAAVAELWARAFRDNPLDVAVVEGSVRRRMRSHRAGMRASLVASRGIAYRRVWQDEAGRVCGGLLATPPGYHPLPEPPLAQQLRCLWLQGPKVISRWGHVGDRLHRVHPVDEHWYLGLLGVEPDEQGQGIGRALMDDFLGRVDRDALPAYLETDRRRSTDFYAAFGFEVCEQLEIFDVAVYCMRRPAQARQD